MDEKLKKSFILSINNYLTLSDTEIEKLLKIFEIRRISKGEYLNSLGPNKTTIFIILSGLVRYFYLTDEGKEWNKAFIPENTISLIFSQTFLLKHSPYTIDALEDTTLLMADYADFESLFENNVMIERLGRKVFESILIAKMKREQSFLQDNAKQRYLDFTQEYPKLKNRLPQYHIASYLGITEASLSRILRN